VEPEPSPLTRSPFATTSTVAASWWPSSSSAGQPESPPAEGDEPASEEAPISEGTEAAATAAAAGAVAADQETDASPSTGETAPEPAAAESDPFADWPSSTTYESPAAAPESAWAAPSSAESTEPAPTASDDLAAAVDQMAGDDAAIPLGPPHDAGEGEDQAAAATATETPTPSTEPVAEPVAEPVTEVPAAGVPAAAGDSLARARSLLDELGALLPSLAAPATTGSSVDAAAIAAGLASARDEAADQQGQLDALMAAVETARSRPRDIDVMLDLSHQVEGIVALKAGYDRCQEAIETALGQLGTGPNS
jgi:hypothetical protein